MDLNLSNSHSCYWKKWNHSSVKKHRNTSINIHNEGSAITERVGKEQLQSWIIFAPLWGKMSVCVYSATSVPASLFITSTEECGGVTSARGRSFSTCNRIWRLSSKSASSNPEWWFQSWAPIYDVIRGLDVERMDAAHLMGGGWDKKKEAPK